MNDYGWYSQNTNSIYNLIVIPVAQLNEDQLTFRQSNQWQKQTFIAAVTLSHNYQLNVYSEGNEVSLSSVHTQLTNMNWVNKRIDIYKLKLTVTSSNWWIYNVRSDYVNVHWRHSTKNTMCLNKNLAMFISFQTIFTISSALCISNNEN